MNWEKRPSSSIWKVYKGNGIITITFTKSSVPNGLWELTIHAWDIPNYEHEIYKRFNEKEFLKIAEDIIMTHNGAKNCILNAIFRGP